LIERIKRQVAHLQAQNPGIRFGLSDYFGFEPEIFKLLDERLAEAENQEPASGRMMECDGCEYRQLAESAGDGHHHHHHHDH